MINLEQLVEVKDADDTVIKNKAEAIPTFKELLLFALRQAHPADAQEAQADAKKRALLIKRVSGSTEIELTEDEKKMAEARVHRFYLQIELKDRLWEILDGK